jgi:hypothetical protein
VLTLQNYKTLFIIVGLVGTMLFVTPTFATLASNVQLPNEEKFSEIWVLGSNHTIGDYPVNVQANTDYKVVVGVANNLGSTSSYVIKVKFRNETDPPPGSTVEAQNALPTLTEYHVLLRNGEVWERQLTFSFLDVSNFEGQCRVGTLKIDAATCAVDKSASWNNESSGYYYQLFLELWIYDLDVQAFQYNDRYVSIWLNMTLFSTS